MWLAFALVSALFLGLYDVAKKQSLKENAVIPVLWFNTLFCSLLMLPFTLLSATTGLLDGSIFYVPSAGWADKRHPTHHSAAGRPVALWRTT